VCSSDLQQVDVNKTLPFRNAYFDAVVAINSLYAISNIDSFLKEIFRVTKPGGILAIVNPKKGAGIFVHIKKQFFSKHAWKLLIGLPLMILIGLFNIIIIMKAGKNEYKFLDYNDLKSKLLDAGYISITSSSVYSEQANLIIGYK
jgi:ubiquinone/menaquinone biosynthesis C-methylase UbiE